MTAPSMRLGVVGVGHLGQSHARILAGMAGVQLVGVADTREAQGRSVADRHGCSYFADYRELLDRVDAISIAVPTTHHLAVASAFLGRGIPAMVEKPLATSLAEAEQLVALSNERGALLQVGHVERFNPALAALEGLRVRPKFITAERQSTYTFRSTDIGVVLDLMIHDLDLILSLVPAPVVAVEAVGVSLFGAHEDVANARVVFEDGCVATLTASRASMTAARKLRIWSAEGYASLDFMTRHATIVRPSDRLRQGELDLEGIDLGQPAAVKAHLFGKVLRVDQVPGPECDQLTLELEDFVRAVRTGSRPRVTGADALRAMRVADQVLRSLNAHAWEGTDEGPVGPRSLPEPVPEPIPGLTGPKSWRYRAGRVEVPPASTP